MKFVPLCAKRNTSPSGVTHYKEVPTQRREQSEDILTELREKQCSSGSSNMLRFREETNPILNLNSQLHLQ